METLLVIISILLVVSVFLSLIRNDFWVFKILEYPRLQKLVIIIAVIGGWLYYWPPETFFQKTLFGALVISFAYLLQKIWPYTVLAKKEMLPLLPGEGTDELKIFSANVLQDNTNYDAMLQQIRATDPDLIFLLETNGAWANATKELEKKYPYTLAMPLENTYGLLLYSRLELKQAKVNFLVKEDIPSVEAVLVLQSGQKLKLWGLHPEPPIPGESLYATAKDKELMKVALMVKDCKLPCIVFGDLNDVAWSHTTKLFRKASELLDPRRGRGFYSTFSAHHWFIRYPLDYIFCSKEFGLVNMFRMPKNGSDHFATFTHLSLHKKWGARQEVPKADKSEMKEVKEMAHQEVKD